MDNVAQANRSFIRAIALKEDGSFWTWGQNGGLGFDATYATVPTELPAFTISANQASDKAPTYYKHAVEVAEKSKLIPDGYKYALDKEVTLGDFNVFMLCSSETNAALT